MKHSFSGFKKFMEDMDPSIEKSSSSGDEKQDYWDSLEDEQKMSWQDLKTAFQSEPYVAAH